jgi:hypothetical protein
MLYKSNNNRSCWFLLHGNKSTHKLRISNRQAESNVQSLFDLYVDTILHQMKGNRNGKQDV